MTNKTIAKRYSQQDANNVPQVYKDTALAEGFTGKEADARAVWLHRSAVNRCNKNARSKASYQSWAEWSGAAYRGRCRRQWSNSRNF